MASRRRGNCNWNPEGPSHSQQQDPDVPTQLNHCKFPTDEPANATTLWINQLKCVWELWKKSDRVTQMLHEYFASAPNPYAAALHIMFNCEDVRQCKASSLAYTVMEEFSRWTADKEIELKQCLTADLKHEAFSLATQQRNISLTKMVFRIYQLKADKELFVEPIRELISRRQYKEACQSATILELHQHFTVEDFIIPLVFQDKLSVAEEFLLGSPEHQWLLVSFLDGLLGKRNIRNEADLIIQRLELHDVKVEKLYHKPLSKLVARLTKAYDLPPECCPNLNQKRNEGALQFLIHKRYIENSLGPESWREMAREAVGNNRDLQLELVACVNSYGDPHEALYWASTYGIPKHKRPYNVRMLQEEDPGVSQQQGAVAPMSSDYQEEEEETWDDELTHVQYHSFPLPQSSIIVVDTQESFEQFLDYIKDVPLVGIDSEWKPYFGTRRNELALIQIATRERVYILDVCNLGSECPKQWHDLGLILFANENIIKLGFGLVMDMNMMKQSLPYLPGASFSGSGYIDLVVLWKKLAQDHSFVFPFTDEDGASGESLTRLVQLCLGQRLDKSDQFSNWERRPLRDSQKLYAALDAYCLLEVYEVLSQSAHKQNIPFYEICNEVMTNIKSPRKTAKHSKKQVKRESTVIELVPSPHMEPIPASHFRVVCDNMVQGLGKMLRKCGVDTAILKNEEDHDVCVRIANQQHRVIVTRGLVYNRLYQHVPQGHCYPVVSDVLEEQLEEVLKYFNVFVTRQDVFSRCQMKPVHITCEDVVAVKVHLFQQQPRELFAEGISWCINGMLAPVPMVCNGGDFVVVTQEVMRQLAQSSQQIAQLHTRDDYSKWEEAEGFSSGSDAYSEEGTSPPCVLQYRNTESGVIIELCQTRKGVTIHVDAVPTGVLQQVQIFYICENCGKCYWDGSHFERLVGGRLQNVVT